MSLYTRSDLYAIQLNTLAFAATWAEKDPLIPITNIALGAMTCATAYQIMKSKNSWFEKLYCFSSYTILPYLVPERYKTTLIFGANVVSLALIVKDSLPKIKRSFKNIVQEPLKATFATSIHLCNLFFPIYTLGTQISKFLSAEKLSDSQETAVRQQEVSKLKEAISTFEYDAHECDKILKIVSNSNIYSGLNKQCLKNHLIHLKNLKGSLIDLIELVKKSKRHFIIQDLNEILRYLDQFKLDDTELKLLKNNELEKINDLMSDIDQLFHDVRSFSSNPLKTFNLIDSLKTKVQNLSEYLASLMK